MAGQIVLHTSDLDDLASRVRGDVVGPDDLGYDAARAVWNGMIDRRPAAVVHAADTSDVAPVVTFARERGLPLAIRGGGHNVAGNGTAEGGVVLDLGGCNSVTVDPRRRVVTTGPGATLGDVDAATSLHGLAVAGGVISTTGIAGLTLGGGFGWLTRKHGLTADNLRAAEVVTAMGKTVHADARKNPELLWGLRGGGGNFGVVTSFEFEAHPLPATVFCGNLIYREPKWDRALLAWEQWTRDLPDQMQSILTVLAPPPDWDLGPSPVLLVRFAWAGRDHSDGEACIAPLWRAVPPDADEVGPVEWTAWQSVIDGLFPKGSRGYWKNTGFDRMDASVVHVLTARAAEITHHGLAFDIHHMGGAFGRVPADATAFPDRTARFWLNIYGFWHRAEDDVHNTAYVRGFAADMLPFASGGQYVNFLGAEPAGSGPAPVSGGTGAWSRALEVYGQRKLERLAALKREYDPGNLFRLNHNIPPDPV